MKILRRFSTTDFQSTGCVATIGNFDGLHLGHQAIIKRVKMLAVEKKLPSVLITFEPTPQEYFLKESASARLMQWREKYDVLSKMGIDYLVLIPFDAELANMPAKTFVEKYLHELLNVKYLLVGDDFKFGKNRTGDFNFLKQYSQYFSVGQCDTLKISGERVSSSLVREALQQSDFVKAKQLLGRAYTMKGRVIRGNQRGRTIGFPTANIAILRKKSPLLGVYAVKIHGLEDHVLFGVANLGSRPTVDTGTRVFLEVHIFDYNKEFYGKFIEVEFAHKLRDEKKFDSFELLKEQIFRDAKKAKLFFLPL